MLQDKRKSMTVRAACCAGLGNLINYTPVVAYLCTYYKKVELCIANKQVDGSDCIFGAGTLFDNLNIVKTDDEFSADYAFAVLSTFYPKQHNNNNFRYFTPDLVHYEGKYHEVECNLDAVRKAETAVLGYSNVGCHSINTYIAHKPKAAELPSRSVGLHLGWGGDTEMWRRKGMPSSFWQEVMRLLIKEGITPVVYGLAKDKELTPINLEEYKDKYVDMQGLIPLNVLYTYMTHLKAFISCDTGLGHYANALNIPTISIFTATSVVKNKPWGILPTVITTQAKCSPCQFTDNWESCTNWVCRDQIDPALVVYAVLQKMR